MKIERWNNARTLKQWKPDRNGAPTTCQFINGTDGSGVAPFRQEGDDFFIFASDICRFDWIKLPPTVFTRNFIFRSVQMHYVQRSSYQGIPAYRYSTDDGFLNDMPECFCVDKIKDALTDERGCLYKGAIDLTQCFGEEINR
jgi:hypothetical protein